MVTIKTRLIRAGAFLGAVMLLASCAAGKRADMFANVDTALEKHGFGAALQEIRASQEGRVPLYPPGNAVSLFLDTGMLRHYDSGFADSFTDLAEAERLIAEAFTRSVTQGVLTFIANDNARDYPGEDFEDIYLSVFNALNFYNQGNLEGALVEIRKLTFGPAAKLPMLNLKYENARSRFGSDLLESVGGLNISLADAIPAGISAANFSDSALARYLSVLFYTAAGNPDSARIEYGLMQSAFASNPRIYRHPIPAAAQNLRNPVPAGQARLNILGFAGMSPRKEERVVRGSFIFLANPELWRPTFRLPVMVNRDNSINRIEIVVDGQKPFNLELIEDMQEVVHETFKARFTDIFFRTYFRVLGKYILVDVAATAAANAAANNSGNSGGNSSGGMARMGTALTGRIAADASESADLRMSRFFPAKAFVGSVDLSPGTYDVRINYYAGRRLVSYENQSVEVGQNGLALLQAVNLR
ncbi:MAG: hypothetical protein FWD94_05795 [Treponema sp.]|nr:hypothetical protein [Treponema sp.]